MAPVLLVERPTSLIADPVEDATRRGFITGVGAAALAAAFLAACGNDDAEPTVAPAPATRTIDTIYGLVDVPAAPRRVVCLDFVSTATMLDLDFAPVGIAPAGVDFLDAYAGAIAATSDVMTADGEPDMELIASLHPDLILSSDWLAESDRSTDYESLSKIAPTVVVEWQQAAGNWKDQAAAFSDAVNRSDVFDGLEAQYGTRIADLRRTYAAVLAGTRWDLVTAGEGEWYLYGAASSHGGVLADAGIQFAAAADQEDGFATYSLEQVNTLAGTDVLVIDARAYSQENFPAMQGFPGYQALPAVTQGQVFTISWFFPSSYKVALALLDEVEAILRQLA